MPKKPPFAKGRRLCIFCGGGFVSGEHIWSDWADKFLPTAANHGRKVFSQTFGGIPTEVEADSRQGAVKKRKVKAVCRVCNSGWMSLIESAAKPYLIPMFINRPTRLGPDEQRILREWIVLKLMAVEWFKPSSAVFTDDQRTAFYARREMPEMLHLYVFDCKDGPELEPYRAQSVTVFDAGKTGVDLSKRNAKLVTIVFGYLLIFAVYSTEVDLEVDLQPPHQAIRLWPVTRDTIVWPPITPITERGAQYLFGMLERIHEQPNVTLIP